MSRFDLEAEVWDQNADIQAINCEIDKQVLPGILAASDTVLELGSGTGILTFKSYRLAKEWLAIDSSEGMIKMLDHKLDASSDTVRSVISTKCCMLTHASQIEHQYDWAVSAMTFHHIPDMLATIRCLKDCVTKGIVICDYMEWPGSRCFHDESKMEGVERHGLDGEQLVSMCLQAGFASAEYRIAFKLVLSRENRPVEFPFLVIHATT